MEVVDCHVHCGKGYSFREYLEKIKENSLSVKRALVFPLASDIYQKQKKDFKDDEEFKEKRRNANKHMISLADSQKTGFEVYPFKFVWNDFSREDLDRYFGVKWQRRKGDPEYEIGSRKFLRFFDTLKERDMPVVFDDEFKNTMKFLNRTQGIKIIIPHLGFGNRNYDALKDSGVWERENIYTDISALTLESNVIKEHIGRYGYERIFFGSDYPINDLAWGLEMVSRLNINHKEKEAILSGNILRLMDEVKK